MSVKISSISVYRAHTLTVTSGDQVKVDNSNDLFPYLSQTVTIDRALGKPDELKATVIRGSEWVWGDLLTFRVRLLVAFDDGTYEMYRIRTATPDANGDNDMAITAWPIWTDLGGTLLRYVRTPSASVGFQYPITRTSVSDLFTDVVFNPDYGIPAFFNLASVSADFASSLVDVERETTTILELINSVSEQLLQQSAVSMEMQAVYNNGTNQVDFTFLREVGAIASELSPSYVPDPSSRPIRGVGQAGVLANRVSLKINEAQNDFYSRLIPFAGSEEELVGIEGTWWDIESYDAPSKTFVLEAGAVPYNSIYVSDPLTSATFFVEVDNLALTMTSDADAKITASSASAVSVTVFSDKTEYATATKLRFYSTIGKDVSGATVPGSFVPFVHDPAAEATKGVVEEKVIYDEITPYENLFEETAFGGTDNGSADMSTWAAPIGGTVKGVTSLPKGMLVHAPAAVYTANVYGAPSGRESLIVGGNFAGVANGDTFEFDVEWEDPLSPWPVGTYTVSGGVYDAANDETTLTLTDWPPGGDPEPDARIVYNSKRTSHTITWNNDYIAVAESATALNATYGTKSAKVTCDIVGIGIKTGDMTILRTAAEPYLSTWAAVKVETGSVSLQVIDANGNIYPPEVGGSDQAHLSASATRTMSIAGILPEVDEDSSVAMYVVVKALEAGTIFYWDALTVTRSPTEWEWRPYMGTRDLYKVAARELLRSGGVQVQQYEVEFYDANDLNPAGGFNPVKVGSWCRLYDMWDEGSSAYKIDVSRRVVRITEEFDLISGNHYKKATINAERPTLADRIKLPTNFAPLGGAPTGYSGGYAAGRYTVTVFQRAATIPSTPTGDTIPPTGWALTPPAADGTPLWTTNGLFNGDTDLLLGVWATPVQLDATIRHYIKATNGTSFKNSQGLDLTLEAHQVVGGVDAILAAGTIKLYVGSDIVNEANGYQAGSDGYTGVIGPLNVDDSLLVVLKDGAGGTPIDSITITDVADTPRIVHSLIFEMDAEGTKREVMKYSGTITYPDGTEYVMGTPRTFTFGEDGLYYIYCDPAESGGETTLFATQTEATAANVGTTGLRRLVGVCQRGIALGDYARFYPMNGGKPVLSHEDLVVTNLSALAIDMGELTGGSINLGTGKVQLGVDILGSGQHGILVSDGTYNRVEIGMTGASTYGMIVRDVAGNVVFNTDTTTPTIDNADMVDLGVTGTLLVGGSGRLENRKFMGDCTPMITLDNPNNDEVTFNTLSYPLYDGDELIIDGNRFKVNGAYYAAGSSVTVPVDATSIDEDIADGTYVYRSEVRTDTNGVNISRGGPGYGVVNELSFSDGSSRARIAADADEMSIRDYYGDVRIDSMADATNIILAASVTGGNGHVYIRPGDTSGSVFVGPSADAWTLPRSLVVGDLLYASATGTLSTLAVSDNDKVLTLVGGVPAWAAAGTPGAHTHVIADISDLATGATGITKIGTLDTGAVPASLVTAGTFGTGSYSIDSTLGILSNGARSDVGLTIRGTGLIAASQYGLIVDPTFSVAATARGVGVYVSSITVADTYTQTDAIGIWVDSGTKGAGSAITNQYGLKIENIALGGTLNYAIKTGTGLVDFGGSVSVTGNITVTGTVDGIDIATDVGANTTHRGLVTGNPHSVTYTEVGADQAGTDNSTDVTLVTTTADYLSIDGSQAITLGLIDLSTDVTGALATGTVPAAQVTAGTFGTGSYTIDTNLTINGNFTQLMTGDSYMYLQSTESAAYLVIDSAKDGLGASVSGVVLTDNGTNVWLLRKDGANDFSLYDYLGIDDEVITVVAGGATTFTSDVGETPAAGVTISRYTAATAILDQYSPALQWSGSLWDGAAAQDVGWRAYFDGLGAVGDVQTTWNLESLEDEVWTERFSVTDAGIVTASAFSGSGVSLTNIPASAITAGTFGAGAFTFDNMLTVDSASSAYFASDRASVGDAAGVALKTAGVSNWFIRTLVDTDLRFYSDSTDTDVLTIAYTTGDVDITGALTGTKTALFGTDGGSTVGDYTMTAQSDSVTISSDSSEAITGSYSIEAVRKAVFNIDSSHAMTKATLIADGGFARIINTSNPYYTVYGKYYQLTSESDAINPSSIAENVGIFLTLSGAGTTGTVTGVHGNVQISPSDGSSTATITKGYGVKSKISSLPSVGNTVAFTEAIGYYGLVQLKGAGTTTATTAAGAWLEVQNKSATTTITNSYAAYLASGNQTGTTTNKYGLYIEDITGGDTLNYAIYSAGGDVYFAGAVSTGALTVGATTAVTAGFILESQGDVRFGDAVGLEGVEIGWSAGGTTGFVQAYNRDASVFKDLIINNSLIIDAAGAVSTTGTVATGALTVTGTASATGNLSTEGNFTWEGQHSATVGTLKESQVTSAGIYAVVGLDFYTDGSTLVGSVDTSGDWDFQAGNLTTSGTLTVGTLAQTYITIVGANTTDTAQLSASDSGDVTKSYFGQFANTTYISNNTTYSSGWAYDDIAIANSVIAMGNGILLGTAPAGTAAPVTRWTVDTAGALTATGAMALTTTGAVSTGALTSTTGVFTSAFPVAISSQAAGSVAIGNNGANYPAVVGRSTTDNRFALELIAASSDTNSDYDMEFNLREQDNTDYTTTTGAGFVWSRWTTNLMSLDRAGDLTLSGTDPSITISSGDLTLETTEAGQTHIYNAKATASQDLFFWNDTSSGTTQLMVLHYSGKLTLTGALAIGGALTGATTGAFSGAVTAASFGGITDTDLLDKSATETVSGSWTFSDYLLVLKNADASTALLSLTNSTAGASSRAQLLLSSDGSIAASLAAYSSTNTQFSGDWASSTVLAAASGATGGLVLYHDTSIRLQTTGGVNAFELDSSGDATFAGAVSTGALTSTTGAFSGDITLSSATATIKANTSDAADNKYLALAGGGDTFNYRGGHIFLYGNEQGNYGDVVIVAGKGDASTNGGEIILSTGIATTTAALTLDQNQDATFTGTIYVASGEQVSIDTGGLALSSGQIASSTGAISFSDENLTTTGTVSTGALTVTGKADIAWGGYTGAGFAVLMGADIGDSTSRTDATEKLGMIVSPHYTNAEEPFGLMYGYSTATTNQLVFGSAVTAANAATDIVFFTAANNTTVVGTERLRIDETGLATFAGAVSTGALTSTTGTFDGPVSIGAAAKTWSAYNPLEIDAVSLFGNTTDQLYLAANAYFNSSNKRKYTGYSTRYYQSAGTHIFQTAASGAPDSAISYSTVLSIDAAGAVSATGAVSTGALTSTAFISAAGYLQFNEGGTVATDNGAGIYFHTGKSTAYAIYREAGAWTAPEYADLRIAFSTGIKIGATAAYGGIRMYSDDTMATCFARYSDGISGNGSGNVYFVNKVSIGTTASTYTLDVNGTLNIAGALTGATTGSFSGAVSTGALTVNATDILLDGPSNAIIGIDRDGTGDTAGIRLLTAGTSNWLIRTQDATNDLRIYSYEKVGYPLIIDSATGAASFAYAVSTGALTVTGAASATGNISTEGNFTWEGQHSATVGTLKESQTTGAGIYAVVGLDFYTDGSTLVGSVDTSGNWDFQAGDITTTGAVTATSFSGDGSALTSVNIDDTGVFSLRANNVISGGGTITYNGSNYLLWSQRLIVISSGRGAHAGTSGYFDITCPTSGTITGVGGAANATATAAGIPLGEIWLSLYYILPIGAAHTSVPANFRLVKYTADVVVPEHWVLIARRNTDTTDEVYLPNGVKLFPGESYNRDRSSNTIPDRITLSGGITTNATETRDKLRLWTSGTYAIGMKSGYTFGGLADYATSFQMSDTADRGWWWGHDVHTDAQGAMALTTDGELSVAHSMRLGYGESDTTSPGATYVLDVSGAVSTGALTATTVGIGSAPTASEQLHVYDLTASAFATFRSGSASHYAYTTYHNSSDVIGGAVGYANASAGDASRAGKFWIYTGASVAFTLEVNSGTTALDIDTAGAATFSGAVSTGALTVVGSITDATGGLTIETTTAGGQHNYNAKATAPQDLFFWNDTSSGTVELMSLHYSGILTVDGDLAITTGSITSASGAISFGNENLTTTGTLSAGTTTIGVDSATALVVGSTTGQKVTVNTGTANYVTVKGDHGLILEGEGGFAVMLDSGSPTGSIIFRNDGAESGRFDASGNFLLVAGKSISINTGGLTLAAGSITAIGGAIDFSNENLTTTGTLSAGATTVTAGDNTYGLGTAVSLELGENDNVSSGAIKLWGTTDNFSLIQQTTTNLHIDAPNGVYVNWYDGTASVGLTVGAGDGTNESIRLRGDDKIEFGTAQDTNLYRSAANTLSTDDAFTAASGTFTGGISATSGAFTLPVSVIYTSTNILTIRGSGAGYVNAGVRFYADHASAGYRGMGTYAYATNDDVEWFWGRPYAGSDVFVIQRATGNTAASDAVADDAHANTTRLAAFNNAGHLTLTAGLTATSFGGITSANLLDKSATETVSGAWTFSSSSYITSSVVGSYAGIRLIRTSTSTADWTIRSGYGNLEFYDNVSASAKLVIDETTGLSTFAGGITTTGAVSTGALTVGSTLNVLTGSLKGPYTDTSGSYYTTLAGGRGYRTDHVQVSSSVYHVLTDIDGGALDTAMQYRITATTTGTGTDTGCVYLLRYDPSGLVWTTRYVSVSGTTSNHVYVYDDAGVPSVKTSHASLYYVKIHTEAIYTGINDSTSDMMGSDFHWQRFAGALTYADGDVSITNDLTVSGNYYHVGTATNFQANTSDTADTASLWLAGGGAISTSRGAYIGIHGNEHSTRPGEIYMNAGTTGSIRVGSALRVGSDAAPAYTLDVAGTGNFTGAITAASFGGIASSNLVDSSVSIQFEDGIQVQGLITADGGITLGSSDVITMSAHSLRVKYRVWTTSTYGIGMDTGYTFGGLLTDYAMTFQMNNEDARGFWWGDSVHTNAQGAMALTTNGKLTVATAIRVGYGETDIIMPGSHALEVSGTAEITGATDIGGNTGITGTITASSDADFGGDLEIGSQSKSNTWLTILAENPGAELSTFTVGIDTDGNAKLEYDGVTAINIGPYANVTTPGTLTVTGALTAASYGGITEANLLDKSAAETVSGGWTFSGAFSVSNATGFDPDTNTSVFKVGTVADGSGWSARGFALHSGTVGKAAGFAINTSNLYFGIQTGTASTMATWMSVPFAGAVLFKRALDLEANNLTTTGTLAAGATTITGALSASGGVKTGADNINLATGASDDLYLYYDGTDAYIKSTSGDMSLTALYTGSQINLIAYPAIGSAPLLEIRSGATEKATFNGNGDLSIDGTLTESASDARYKDDVVTMTGSLNILMQLNPVTYTWNDRATNGMTGMYDVGLIAQEVQDTWAFPVWYRADKDRYGLHYNKFIPLLIGGVQEIKSEQDKLRDRVTALETENSRLKTRLEALEE